MIRLLGDIWGIATLVACDAARPQVQGLADDLARGQARKVVNQTLAEKAPGATLTPLTDCVINTASAQEILTIAKASITGVTPATTNLVLDIAARPKSVDCLLKAGIAAL